MNILGLVYSHTDFFPPTQNAIEQLSKNHEVSVLARNVVKDFPKTKEGINYFTVGKYRPIREIEKVSTLKKVAIFIRYCASVYGLTKRLKIDAVIAYDNIPLLAFWLMQKFMFKSPILWYHNHDKLDYHKVRKYSIQWFSGYLEKRMFKKVQIFSIPAVDRKASFNLEYFKGSFFVIPNYPSLKRYDKIPSCSSPKENEPIKIVYQGEIGYGHGFEQLLQILNRTINGRSLELHMVGFIRPEYKIKLMEIAEKNNSVNHVKLYDRLPYDELPFFTNKGHIGWAAYLPINISFASGATASNKIYEYMALGLPVVLFNDEHFQKYLEEYEWANFCEDTPEAIFEVLSKIVQGFDHLSAAAKADFRNKLNFETHFRPASERLLAMQAG